MFSKLLSNLIQPSSYSALAVVMRDSLLGLDILMDVPTAFYQHTKFIVFESVLVIRKSKDMEPDSAKYESDNDRPVFIMKTH